MVIIFFMHTTDKFLIHMKCYTCNVEDVQVVSDLLVNNKVLLLRGCSTYCTPCNAIFNLATIPQHFRHWQYIYPWAEYLSLSNKTEVSCFSALQEKALKKHWIQSGWKCFRENQSHRSLYPHDEVLCISSTENLC